MVFQKYTSMRLKSDPSTILINTTWLTFISSQRKIYFHIRLSWKRSLISIMMGQIHYSPILVFSKKRHTVIWRRQKSNQYWKSENHLELWQILMPPLSSEIIVASWKLQLFCANSFHLSIKTSKRSFEVEVKSFNSNCMYLPGFPPAVSDYFIRFVTNKACGLHQFTEDGMSGEEWHYSSQRTQPICGEWDV